MSDKDWIFWREAAFIKFDSLKQIIALKYLLKNEIFDFVFC
jgi:hypothetical protein